MTDLPRGALQCGSGTKSLGAGELPRGLVPVCLLPLTFPPGSWDASFSTGLGFLFALC